MFSTHQIEFRPLKSSELDQWFDHCMYVFNKGEYSDSYRQYFVNHFQNDPWSATDSIFVAIKGEEILSTIRIFNRKIMIEGEVYKMAGIGEVSTQVAYQKQGLSRKLFELVYQKIEADQVPISMLCGDKELYERYGYQLLHRKWKKAQVTSSPQVAPHIRLVDWHKDLKQIQAIYELSNKEINGSIVRNHPLYWEKWFVSESPQCHVSVDLEDQVTGYMVTRFRKESVIIKEFGGITDNPYLFDQLLINVLAHLNISTCEVHCPEYIYSELPFQPSVEKDYWMTRLHMPLHINNKVQLNTTQQLTQYMQSSHPFFISDSDGF